MTSLKNEILNIFYCTFDKIKQENFSFKKIYHQFLKEKLEQERAEKEYKLFTQNQTQPTVQELKNPFSSLLVQSSESSSTIMMKNSSFENLKISPELVTQVKSYFERKVNNVQFRIKNYYGDSQEEPEEGNQKKIILEKKEMKALHVVNYRMNALNEIVHLYKEKFDFLEEGKYHDDDDGDDSKKDIEGLYFDICKNDPDVIAEIKKQEKKRRKYFPVVVVTKELWEKHVLSFYTIWRITNRVILKKKLKEVETFEKCINIIKKFKFEKFVNQKQEDYFIRGFIIEVIKKVINISESIIEELKNKFSSKQDLRFYQEFFEYCFPQISMNFLRIVSLFSEEYEMYYKMDLNEKYEYKIQSLFTKRNEVIQEDNFNKEKQFGDLYKKIQTDIFTKYLKSNSFSTMDYIIEDNVELEEEVKEKDEENIKFQILNVPKNVVLFKTILEKLDIKENKEIKLYLKQNEET